MPEPSRTVKQALKAAGAVLIRHKKHMVYQLPNGQKITISVSASCPFAERNQLADIKRSLKLRK